MRRHVATALLVVAFGASVTESTSPRDVDTQEKLNGLIAKIEAMDKHIAGSSRRIEPATVYAVTIDGDPAIGPGDAKVTIVKASDYACPFCQRNEAVMAQLIADYPGQVRVVYKDFIVHPKTATTPALAACAAHRQGRFEAFNHELWTTAFGDGSEKRMSKLATQLGLNVKRFQADLHGRECRNAVDADYEQLKGLGVSGTPTFFINGHWLSGARPIADFKELVDAELASAEKKR